jgi:hypothetical protein
MAVTGALGPFLFGVLLEPIPHSREPRIGGSLYRHPELLAL